MNWTVARKMALLAIVVLLGTFSIAGLAQYQMAKVYEAASYSTVNTVPSLVVLDKMRDQFLRLRIRLSQHVLNTDDSKMAEIEKTIAASGDGVLDSIRKYEKLVSDDKDKDIVGKEKVLIEKIIASLPPVLAESRANHNEKARELLEALRPQLNEFTTLIDQHFDYNVELGQKGAAEGEATKKSAAIFSLSMAALVLGLVGIISFVIARDIVRQLGGEPRYAAGIVREVAQGNFAVEVQLRAGDQESLLYSMKQMVEKLLEQIGGEPAYAARVVNTVAQGDLTVDVQLRPGDQASLLYAMKTMVGKLASVLTEVSSGAVSLANASEEISATAQSLSQAASEQAAGVEETSASIEQMTASIAQNTENAKVTDGMAGKASIQAAEGGTAVKSTADAMTQIARKISIIDDIAYQTNLLALNAAIEAAQEISEVAASSVELAQKAGKLLDEMVPSIQRTSDLVQEITAASEEQSSGVAQINSAISQLSLTTQQNASSSEELAATSEEMSSQAEQLQQAVAFFRVAGAIRREDSGRRRAAPVLAASTTTQAEDARFVRY